MLALDAQITVKGAGGAREIAAADFFQGLFATALAPGELVTEIRIPARTGAGLRWGSAFLEFSRRHGDFALAGVAVSVAVDAGGQCAHASIALIGVADRPVLATKAAASLVGHAPSQPKFRDAAEIAATKEIDPSGDIHASADYRRHLARVLIRRALERAFATVAGGLQAAGRSAG
jgi:carbon-monoxide dehydrogenase medium subunit